MLPPDPNGWRITGLSGPQDAERFVADRVREGSDYLKVFVENAADVSRPTLAPETVAAVCAAARGRGLTTDAHAPDPLGLRHGPGGRRRRPDPPAPGRPARRRRARRAHGGPDPDDDGRAHRPRVPERAVRRPAPDHAAAGRRRRRAADRRPRRPADQLRPAPPTSTRPTTCAGSWRRGRPWSRAPTPTTSPVPRQCCTARRCTSSSSCSRSAGWRRPTCSRRRPPGPPTCSARRPGADRGRAAGGSAARRRRPDARRHRHPRAAHGVAGGVAHDLAHPVPVGGVRRDGPTGAERETTTGPDGHVVRPGPGVAVPPAREHYVRL